MRRKLIDRGSVARVRERLHAMPPLLSRSPFLSPLQERYVEVLRWRAEGIGWAEIIKEIYPKKKERPAYRTFMRLIRQLKDHGLAD